MSSFTSQMSCPLSQREAQCLEGLARGLSNSDIAKLLHISVATVALHLGNARRKLGAKTREQAVALAVEQGFVSPTSGYASRI
jgi:DNA-binding CsgD family transcriptional regulator